MSRSRGQFDERGDSERESSTPDGVLASGRAWFAFHRVESLLVAWVVVGGIVTTFAFGFSNLALESGATAPAAVRSLFWSAILLGIPLLAGVLVVHAAVDVYRLAFTDAQVGSFGHVALRVLQTGSVLTFAWGIEVLVFETADATVEFDPAALLSAFLLVVGLIGMLGTVALDGLVRLVRGKW